MNSLLPDLPPIEEQGKKKRGRGVTTAEKPQKESKQKPAGERPGVCECGSGKFSLSIKSGVMTRTCKNEECGRKTVV
ncbi:hypothetical protein SAMN04489735_104535 [Aneurinibacillus thermoaerophilus]|uniref:Uncharacterized protein n=1 Tax=Aneurinibacillus thermoaerophilus TaxID=143495 RepID=A0A1G8ELJ8_ANETH|nr:hypothetical protein SAMN04489735_104535 [Aneurinibacillus thermoaerophilus]